eukprot:SAG25_NODE_483_length_7496_cov_10.633635_4_plen_87_part_00
MYVCMMNVCMLNAEYAANRNSSSPATFVRSTKLTCLQRYLNYVSPRGSSSMIHLIAGLPALTCHVRPIQNSSDDIDDDTSGVLVNY